MTLKTLQVMLHPSALSLFTCTTTEFSKLGFLFTWITRGTKQGEPRLCQTDCHGPVGVWVGTLQGLLLFSEKCLLPQCRPLGLCFPARVYPFMTSADETRGGDPASGTSPEGWWAGPPNYRNLEVGHKTGLVAFRSWTSEVT